ncbi:ribokinase [Enterococcus pallens]|uniref:Deoxyribokinase n=1 Tax=Enterococcus pallens ATCC BAA-351 TaxID=1158607 RepID=R2SK50_9ENTE|nr:ribokinase [Enterococcus pallens]EOH95555.1 ribokinase [Enterococcus pallens ATCC BAA-351]EOU21308.1 ribokinase [Enterococcus pallens ATCC BAA-351]OJG78803.1 ribokinase [Enterococcus pallens]
MKKILVIGSFMTDLVVQADRLPKNGETFIGNSFNQFTGGKGANQAVTAARLGGKVDMIGKVGDDAFGQEHIEALENDGIDSKNVFRDPKKATGVGSITLDAEGNNRIIVVPGANMELTVEEIDSCEALIAANDIIILQLEVPLPVVYRSIELARKHNKFVIFNPAPAQKIDEKYNDMINLIIPNETEAELLTGIAIKTDQDAQKAAAELRNKGFEKVIITLGERGILFQDNTNSFFKNAHKVQVEDTTAAGDSFIGGLAFGLSIDYPIEAALEWAVATSAVTVSRLGAQPSLPTFSEVEKQLGLK